jgi:hypothetical protein
MSQLPNPRVAWLLMPLLMSACVTPRPDVPRLPPDPLIAADGSIIETADQWRQSRRPEILEQFRRHMYGRSPKPTAVRVEEMGETLALDGKARRKQWRVRYDDAEHAFFEVLMYLPVNASKPVPAFLGLNFFGNQSIHSDPGIRMPTTWMRNDKKIGVANDRANESTRGKRSSRWPVEKILARGYGLVTVYYGDIDPDFDDGFINGVHGVLDPPLAGKRATDAWGSIAAWAWGLSRVLDTLEMDADVDAEHIAVLGHSRLGKTSLWAGAQDERFAMVISNDSGCGGAAYSRRRSGETVKVINRVFPHWFCTAFRAFDDREDQLPIDQHLLIAAIAPRPAYIASAAQDSWADPEGEFLSALGADPVYRLLGTDGLPATKMPPVDQPVHGQLGYHVRAGKHDLTWQDWQQYLTFADRHFR